MKIAWKNWKIQKNGEHKFLNSILKKFLIMTYEKKLIQTCQKTQKELSSSFQSLNLVPVERAMILEPGVVIITTSHVE